MKDQGQPTNTTSLPEKMTPALHNKHATPAAAGKKAALVQIPPKMPTESPLANADYNADPNHGNQLNESTPSLDNQPSSIDQESTSTNIDEDAAAIDQNVQQSIDPVALGPGSSAGPQNSTTSEAYVPQTNDTSGQPGVTQIQ